MRVVAWDKEIRIKRYFGEFVDYGITNLAEAVVTYWREQYIHALRVNKRGEIKRLENSAPVYLFHAAGISKDEAFKAARKQALAKAPEKNGYTLPLALPGHPIRILQIKKMKGMKLRKALSATRHLKGTHKRKWQVYQNWGDAETVL